MKTNRPIFYLLLLTFYLFSSCTEDYRFPKTKGSWLLVVDGCITDEPGPYQIKLTECISNISSKVQETTEVPVTGARVVITDDLGNRDELLPLWEKKRFENYTGVYYTTSIAGIPGREYTLSVEYNNRIYTATDRMPVYKAVIDSIVMEATGKEVIGKGPGGFNVPLLYFAEPQEEANYYLFFAVLTDSVYAGSPGKMELPGIKSFAEAKRDLSRGSSFWKFPVAGDRFMGPYMAGYKASWGSSSRVLYTGTDVRWDFDSGYLDYYMNTISGAAYRYYQALTEQVSQDGGVYSPAPASPPTNVSAGGQGFFMAASVSTCRSSFIDNY